MSNHDYEPRPRTVYAPDGTEIQFRPWDGDDYLYAFYKGGDPNDPDKDKFCLNVYTISPDKKESTYYAALGGCTESIWVQFQDKFLAHPKFRKKYLIDGEGWDGEVVREKTDIHPKCASAIARLEKTKESKLNFRMFAALRTFGFDSFSRKKAPELEKFLGEDKVAQIKSDERMKEPSLYASALKWCARGLSPNHAIRKVLTDAEVAQNARGR